MYYIDTDVLIHSFVKQNIQLHSQVKALLSQFVVERKVSISWLSIQETAFVLAKLNQLPLSIINSINFLVELTPFTHDKPEFVRASELAKIIGFKSINDCLYIAIAEKHCTDLYTCNTKDFKRLEPHTTLNIHFIK